MYRKLNEKIAELTGIFSLLVIPLSILSCIFYKNKPSDWFYTVSDTYYLSPSFAVLMSCSSLLSYLYCGQNRIENLINRINAVSALLIVIFPCSNLYGLEKVGIFQLADKTSSILHTIFSFILAAGVYINLRFIFTRDETETKKSVLKVFSILEIISIILFILGKLKVINPIYKLFAEIITFTVYGISWIMKSNKHTVYSD